MSNVAAEWLHGRLIAEFELNNLLFPQNGIKENMQTTHYDFFQPEKSELHKFYASFKVYYSIDYGKKTAKATKYNRAKIESVILK